MPRTATPPKCAPHAAQTDRPTGRLGALDEDGIGAALRAMHADVVHS
ncbi:hypothetical protein [Streptomyces sp. NRRL F-5630]